MRNQIRPWLTLNQQPLVDPSAAIVNVMTNPRQVHRRAVGWHVGFEASVSAGDWGHAAEVGAVDVCAPEVNPRGVISVIIRIARCRLCACRITYNTVCCAWCVVVNLAEIPSTSNAFYSSIKSIYARGESCIFSGKIEVCTEAVST